MNQTKPAYFDSIQKKASERWDKLQTDPELAAPWWQLFKQIQSPRHVLSELLQNADDAEAVEVSIEIQNVKNQDVFSFWHNGKDFTQDDFASLCRFGYSNKRLLHTIGFRGIGFKSVFSLGETVGVRTPTLTFVFKKERFTQPEWWEKARPTSDGRTGIFVEIAETNRRDELQKNITDWFDNPFSLLFFNHIRRIQTAGRSIDWQKTEDGPVPQSEWMARSDEPEKPYLLIRSDFENFPENCLQEIQRERMVTESETFDLPPCKIDLALSAPGKLFVVLPTGVALDLPFAINAPFIQDPARFKIKDPVLSPTNRWLLQRAGDLAARTLLKWLENADLDLEKRARAYQLIPPDAVKDDNSLENACKQVISEAFWLRLQDEAYVLAENGKLFKAGQVVSIPSVFWQIWTKNQLTQLTDQIHKNKSLVCQHLSIGHLQKLEKRRAVERISDPKIASVLEKYASPKPKSWAALLDLWDWCESNFTGNCKSAKICPVVGQNTLYSAKEIAYFRLDETEIRTEDRALLAQHLHILDENWLKYLSREEQTSQKKQADKVKRAQMLLFRLGLESPAQPSEIFAQVIENFFAQERSLADTVRLTQLAAKFKIEVPDSFVYVVRSGARRRASEMVMYPLTPQLEGFIPTDMHDDLFLHLDYTREFFACTKQTWNDWIRSGKTKIQFTLIPKQCEIRGYYPDVMANQRGYYGSIAPKQYRSSNYVLVDWDFPKEYWECWTNYAQQNNLFWVELLQFLSTMAMHQVEYAQIFQAHKHRLDWRKPLTPPEILPGWIMRLRGIPCLRDTRGNLALPHELMRRTPQTEPLLDIERFIDASLDTPTIRPILDLLGVRSTPTGPEQIMQRIRALAQAEKPPILELAKWYSRLDQLWDACTTEQQQQVRADFAQNALIFSEDNLWHTAETIFLQANEADVAGAALIHNEFRSLALWHKIGVPERPTLQSALEWLKTLPIGEKLAASDAQRIKKLLAQYPQIVWETCNAWLTLSGMWQAAEQIRYAFTMQSLTEWTHLFDWVKDATADLKMLDKRTLSETPFCEIPRLASLLEYRHETPVVVQQSTIFKWLNNLAIHLCHIRLDDDALTQSTRQVAQRLAQTRCQQANVLNVLAYLDEKPAGRPVSAPLVWVGTTLYWTDMPQGRLAKILAERLSAAFSWDEMSNILAYCFERDDSQIEAYLRENYHLEDIPIVLPEPPTLPEEPVLAANTPPVAARNHNIAVTESDLPPDSDIATPRPDSNVSLPKERLPQSPKPSLVERFAYSCGFEKHSNDRFVHPDNGEQLLKQEGSFAWVWCSAQGEPMRYYWVKEHCLQEKPLEIAFEIYNLLERFQDNHALLLKNIDGEPFVIPGKQVVFGLKAKKLSLHPATFRLTINHSPNGA